MKELDKIEENYPRIIEKSTKDRLVIECGSRLELDMSVYPPSFEYNGGIDRNGKLESLKIQVAGEFSEDLSIPDTQKMLVIKPVDHPEFATTINVD